MCEKTSEQIGIINEIGDLGLGFNYLTNKDQKAYDGSASSKSDNTEVINEKKDK